MGKQKVPGALLCLMVLFISLMFGGLPSVAAARVTVILLDRTNTTKSQQTKEAMKGIVMETLLDDRRVEVEEGVLVYGVSRDSITRLPPEFSGKKPKQRPTLGPLLSDPRIVENKFKREFLDPIGRLFDREIGTSDYTPLTQVIMDVLLMVEKGNQRVRLMIFSDMFENTPGFSLYKQFSSNEDMMQRFVNSRKGRASLEDVRGLISKADIEVYCIPRDVKDDRQLKNRKDFWDIFFGKIVKWNYLPGM